MQWQDWVFTTGQIIFVFALVPAIRGKEKPPFLTSLLTSLILYTFSYTQFTLDLWFSSMTAAINATAWLILAYQTHPGAHKK